MHYNKISEPVDSEEKEEIKRLKATGYKLPGGYGTCILCRYFKPQNIEKIGMCYVCCRYKKYEWEPVMSYSCGQYKRKEKTK